MRITFVMPLLCLLLGFVGAAEVPGDLESAKVRARAAIAEMMRNSRVPGVAVAVAQDGRVLWEEAWGWEDREKSIPATPQTRFGLGSVTKPMTTALIARLVESGVLDWDAPAERYLRDFPHAGHGLTLRRLASHLSGLGDQFDAANRTTRVHYSKAAEVLPAMLAFPLVAKPGERINYTNSAYTVLAAIIEQATGLEYLEAAQRHVFTPLRLESIAVYDFRQPAEHQAAYYVEQSGAISRAPDYDPSYKRAAAGLVGTAGDVARFASALARPGFLSEATLHGLFTPQKDNAGSVTSFGLGWMIGADAGFGMGWIIGPDSKPRDIVHHRGGGIGISCWVALDRESGLAVAVLANLTGAPVGGPTFDTILEAFLPLVVTPANSPVSSLR